MAQNENINKILVAVDGSDQSIQAVRYASLVMPCKHTKVILFHVGDKLSELFLDFDSNPFYKSMLPEIKCWMADQQKHMGIFFKICSNILFKAGFPKDSVVVKAQPKKLSVSRDILKESYNGYNALLMGRTGMSKLKDALLKSVAAKLVKNIRHIPVIVVGGIPASRKILLAFDGSYGAMKSLTNIGLALGTSQCTITLCYAVKSNKNIESKKKQIDRYFKEAEEKLVEAGMMPSAVNNKILTVDKDLAVGIVDEAAAGDYGTIVTGRRSFVRIIENFFIGRVSNKILNLASELTVCIT